ncbi:MAG TPA: DUF3810 domain-containing protein [Sphingobacteriaceae bacterium]
MLIRRNRLFRKVLLSAFLLLLLILLNLAGKEPQAVEQYYSQGIYRFFSKIFQAIFNPIPFSVGDLWYLILTVAIVLMVLRMLNFLFRRQFLSLGTTLVNFIIAAQILILGFYILWGMNYYRPPASVRLDLPDSSYTKTELLQVTQQLIDSANAIRRRVPAADFNLSDSAILKKSVSAVHRLAQRSPEFKTFQPNVKLSLISGAVSYLGTAGYYNPFTSEAQINPKMPVWLKPLTACHEMAHQMGFNREDEANFVGFLAAKDSEDALIRYSAYYMAVEEFMFEAMLRDTVAYKNLRESISGQVMNDFKTDQQFWLSYRGVAGELSSIFYDNYLKFNNQPEGLRTYNRMIRLTMAWYKKDFGKSL